MNKHSTKSGLKYKNNGVNVFKNTVYMHTNPSVRKSDKEKYTRTITFFHTFPKSLESAWWLKL